MASTTIFDLLDMNVYPPIADTIIGLLGPHDIIRLSKTCRFLSGLYPALLKREWDVDRRLRRFVDNPFGLRATLAKLDALITGGFVTQYFDRQFWPSSDLDIVVTEKVRATMIEYLVEKEGYRKSGKGSRDPYSYAHNVFVTDVCQSGKIIHNDERLTVQQCKSFIKDNKAGETLKVQVVTMEGELLAGLVDEHYTNVVCNFMTGRRAYHYFARPTFIERRAYTFKMAADDPNGPYYKNLLEKYGRRGWAIETMEGPVKPTDDSSYDRSRRFGDRSSWVITFDNASLPEPRTPDYVYDSSSFGVTLLNLPENDLRRYKSKYNSLRLAAWSYETYLLQHAWVHETICDRGLLPSRQLSFGRDFLFPLLDWITYQRLMAMPKEDWPAHFDHLRWRQHRLPCRISEPIVYSMSRNWQPPSNWQFLDRWVPWLYKEWEKIKRAGRPLAKPSERLHLFATTNLLAYLGEPKNQELIDAAQADIRVADLREAEWRRERGLDDPDDHA